MIIYINIYLQEIKTKLKILEEQKYERKKKRRGRRREGEGLSTPLGGEENEEMKVVFIGRKRGQKVREKY